MQKLIGFWASLVVQWLRVHLPMQGHGFDPWIIGLRRSHRPRGN